MDRLQPLLLEYQQLLHISERMLKLARLSLWEELIELEVDYLCCVEKTTHLPLSQENTSATLQEALRQLIGQILENEREVKHLLQSRMDELKSLIGSSARQQAINSAYGPFADHTLSPGENF